MSYEVKRIGTFWTGKEALVVAEGLAQALGGRWKGYVRHDRPREYQPAVRYGAMPFVYVDRDEFRAELSTTHVSGSGKTMKEALHVLSMRLKDEAVQIMEMAGQIEEQALLTPRLEVS